MITFYKCYFRDCINMLRIHQTFQSDNILFTTGMLTEASDWSPYFHTVLSVRPASTSCFIQKCHGTFQCFLVGGFESARLKWAYSAINHLIDCLTGQGSASVPTVRDTDWLQSVGNKYAHRWKSKVKCAKSNLTSYPTLVFVLCSSVAEAL